MDNEIKIIMVGTHDSGKYWLAEKLMEASDSDDGGLFEKRDQDLPTCHAIEKEIGGFKLYLVTTPSIANESGKLSVKNWNDLIVAQDFCQDYTNVFLIVLNSQEPDISKNLVENFKSVFGDKSRMNCVVVYTNNPRHMSENYDRELECKFDFVDDQLKGGYPILKWKSDVEVEPQINKLRGFIRKIAGGCPYTLEDFKEAQLKVLKQWVAKSNKVAKTQMDAEEASCFYRTPPDLMKKLYAKDDNKYFKALDIFNKK